MASVFILTNPPSDIHYSLIDGRVFALILYGEELFDEGEGIAEEGWSDKLIKFVKEQRLNIDKDERGLHAFVWKLIKDGHIKAG